MVRDVGSWETGLCKNRTGEKTAKCAKEGAVGWWRAVARRFGVRGESAAFWAEVGRIGRMGPMGREWNV